MSCKAMMSLPNGKLLYVKTLKHRIAKFNAGKTTRRKEILAAFPSSRPFFSVTHTEVTEEFRAPWYINIGLVRL